MCMFFVRHEQGWSWMYYVYNPKPEAIQILTKRWNGYIKFGILIMKCTYAIYILNMYVCIYVFCNEKNRKT